MHIAIIANGDIGNYAAAIAKLDAATHIIACDGGLRHAEAMGIWPDTIIGDLDSAPQAYLAQCKARNITMHTFPTEKDDTDLALAVQHALGMGTQSVVILGALGGRLDHTLGNIHVLAAVPVPAEIWDYETSVIIVKGSLTLAKENYATLSLIPLTTSVTGIVTLGLKYPLNGDTLQMGSARGISNCFQGEEAIITTETGMLLAVRHM